MDRQKQCKRKREKEKPWGLLSGSSVSCTAFNRLRGGLPLRGIWPRNYNKKRNPEKLNRTEAHIAHCMHVFTKRTRKFHIIVIIIIIILCSILAKWFRAEKSDENACKLFICLYLVALFNMAFLHGIIMKIVANNSGNKIL